MRFVEKCREQNTTKKLQILPDLLFGIRFCDIVLLNNYKRRKTMREEDLKNLEKKVKILNLK